MGFGKNIDWIDIRSRAIAFFFPERCVLCDEVVAYDDLWCNKCGFNRYGKIDSQPGSGFTSALAVAEYDGKTREALWRIKDRPDKRTLEFFAGLMFDAMRLNWPQIKFDLILPVPINKSRLEKRGFNQAEKLAERLSGLTGIPMRTDVLIRYDDARVQHTLKIGERIKNAEKAYDTANIENVPKKTILLVDDVFTTGSTFSACSEKLLDAGAHEVYVIAATAVKLRGN